jgi:hypothetical protein
MRQIWKQIKNEWEIAFCLAALLLLLTAGVFSWLNLNADTAPKPSRRQAPKEDSLLAPDAYAMVETMAQPNPGFPSPFVFQGQTKAPKVEVPEHRPKPKPKPPTETVVVKPKPEPKPEPEPIPEPTTVKRLVYGTRVLTYLYNSRDAAGKPVVTVQLADPATRQVGIPAVIPIGGAIQGIRVASFDERNLVVLDARGRKHIVPFGKSRTMSSAPRVVEVPR